VRAGDVEIIDASGRSHGTFGPDGKPVPPNIMLDRQSPASKDDKSGVRLESLGKGFSVADIDDKTKEVVIRRSGRVVERLADEQAIAEFATKKKLSETDRVTLEKLHEARGLDPAERARMKATLGPDSPQMVNAINEERERGRTRSEVEKNDAEVYEWVERQRRLRARAAGNDQRQAATGDERASPASAPKGADKESPADREAREAAAAARARAIPPEIAAAYLQVGDKFFHPNAKALAFVDRGDKVETPSSSPKVAEALVKIAEARGWEEIRVRGTEGFRREVWLEASAKGIHVDGYKPSELDKAELERRRRMEASRDTNTIEVNSRDRTFRTMPAQDGVRHDPGLAPAYATEAAAKRFAEQLHPNNREKFVDSVRDSIGSKLEKGEPVGVKLKVPEGQLVDHGRANYNFDKDEKPSYYVKLQEASGRERIYWGVGLEKAMAAVEAKAGDTVQLRVTESRGVVVEGNVRDAAGKVIGSQTVDSHRNDWQASVTARAQERSTPPPQTERQPPQDRAR
jgi:putative DNA primase/helicase